MARAAASSTLAARITLATLTREELLALVGRLQRGPIAPRELWSVRWGALSARAIEADRAALAASTTWEAALAVTRATDRASAAFLIAQRASDRAWCGYKGARDRADRAHAAADRAYASLVAAG